MPDLPGRIIEDAGGVMKMIRDAIGGARKEIRTVNILIAGRTGLGKSTLINAVFRGRLAATGQGKPVTKEIRWITKKGIPLAICDTRGLEAKEFPDIIDELMEEVRSRAGETDESKHVHIAWICVAEDSRRIEDADIELHERLAEHMPILGVITKARNDDGFKAAVTGLLPKAANVVRVRAKSERLDDGHVIPSMGLNDLVEATAELIPEAFQRSFAAAQKVSLDNKKKSAHIAVAAAATAAVGVGAAPIPFADAVVLVPIQVGMLARISTVFEIDLSEGFLRTLVTAMVGTTGATLAGRAIVSGLLKLIPGVGSVVGGAIAATTAATLTTTLGEIYVAVLAALFEKSGGTAPSTDDVAREFRNRLGRFSR